MTRSSDRIVQAVSSVAGQKQLCREHFRMTLRLSSFPAAYPGQFVHLCPDRLVNITGTHASNGTGFDAAKWVVDCAAPMLRRAFSIAGLRRDGEGVEIDVIYRVVGTATRWMEQLRAGDRLNLLGPLGGAWPIHPEKKTALLVAGGVGLPPLLWLSETVAKHGKETVAFFGAQSGDLIPLTVLPSVSPDSSAQSARRCAEEFSKVGVPTVISTDDGTVGFRGHVGAALSAYLEANDCPGEEKVVYTCGPERMMRFVAGVCATSGIRCYACVERNMACGTGMCQSCVVPVADSPSTDAWRYQLCCSEGPVFDAACVLWDEPARERRVI